MGSSLTKVLDVLGVGWKAVSDVSAAETLEPPNGWSGAVITVDGNPEEAFRIAAWLRTREDAAEATLMLVSAESLPELSDNTEHFDDFCLTPFHPAELEARLGHMLHRHVEEGPTFVITFGPLSLNVETYQAVVDGRALDLTYMEYELLRFLAAQPGKVFSREVLLSEVWGYDYYGGARTVDVHIRRLRSKLGEEHANLISTVRSVGYRLGSADWS
ncbi:MAG: DNA-binding response OmpR family regulator [Verrucomicrobiales bacterium]|jgi:DNA-binding response OmpR family regulator